MEKWKQKFAGIVIGTILALSLGGKAYAEAPEPEDSDPKPPESEESMQPGTGKTDTPSETKDSAPESTPPAPVDDTTTTPPAPTGEGDTETPSGDGDVAPDAQQPEGDTQELLSVSALSTAPEPVMLTAAAPEPVMLAAATPDPAATSDAPVATSAASDTVITVGGVSFDGTEDVYGPEWGDTEDTSGNLCGWRYSAENEALMLVNYDGSGESISVENGDLTIMAAGLNRIASLTCQGVVDLIGTGILLADEIELGETGVVNVQPNADIYGQDGGSVAVFLKQDDGSYKLMNGSVPGILDGVYTLPEGVNLVVPSGSTLLLGSLVGVQDGDSISYYFGDETVSVPDGAVVKETAGQLTIGSGSSLTVQSGGTLKMVGTPSVVSSGDLITPLVDIAGTLKLESEVEGEGFVKQREGAKLLGRGALSADFFETADMDLLISHLGDIGKTTADKLKYSELKALFEAVYGARFPDGSEPVFTVTLAGGETVEIGPEDEDDEYKTVSWEGDLPDISYDSNWQIVIGNSIIPTDLSFTGEAVLGGYSDLNGGTFHGGNKTTILQGRESTPRPAQTVAAVQNVRVVVTENISAGTWTLSVYIDDLPVRDLGGVPVKVRMNFVLPEGWDSQAIYVVFRNADGSLTAIPAVYNPVTGTLVFDSALVGDFVVVCFDYDGEPFSEGFYAALSELEEVKRLR